MGPMNHPPKQTTVRPDYYEFRPPPSVSEFVLCFWRQTTGPGSTFCQQILPDCCIDIILINGTWRVIGPWTEALVAELPPMTQILGIRCQPGFAPSVLGLPASELLNQSVALSDLLGKDASSPFTRIAEQSYSAIRMQSLELALWDRVAKTTPADSATQAAIQWIARNPRGRVEELSRKLGLSSRQLQRRFTTAVGYGPKLFQSILRFQRLLHLASSAGAETGLADLAAVARYADQAHMNREVRRFSGKPPGTLLPSSRSTLCLSHLV